MHILVLLEANFLNINNNDKQIPLQPTENVHTSKTAREMGSCWCSRMGRRGGDASLGRTGKGSTAQAVSPWFLWDVPFVHRRCAGAKYQCVQFISL